MGLSRVYRAPLGLGAAAAVAIVVGAFLDWSVIEGGAGSVGFDRDGEVTFAAGGLALVAAVLFVVSERLRELWAAVMLVGGAVAAALGFDNMAEVRAASDLSHHDFEIATGLWLTSMGGLVLALAATTLLVALASEYRNGDD
jgi:hypothetical protein